MCSGEDEQLCDGLQILYFKGMSNLFLVTASFCYTFCLASEDAMVLANFRIRWGPQRATIRSSLSVGGRQTDSGPTLYPWPWGGAMFIKYGKCYVRIDNMIILAIILSMRRHTSWKYLSNCHIQNGSLLPVAKIDIESSEWRNTKPIGLASFELARWFNFCLERLSVFFVAFHPREGSLAVTRLVVIVDKGSTTESDQKNLRSTASSFVMRYALAKWLQYLWQLLPPSWA